MLRQISLPNMSRVAPGSNVILEVPVGPTHYTHHFRATGTEMTVAHIEKIGVFFQGRQVMVFSNLQRLLDLNTFWKRGGDVLDIKAPASGLTSTIEFSMHFFRGELNEKWRRLGGVGTADLTRFHYEIQLAANAPADVALSAHADIDPVSAKVGAFFRVTEYPTAAAIAGWNELDKLPRNAYLAALHFAKSDVTELDVEGDSVRYIAATKATLERRAKNASPRERVPVSDRFTHVDFVPHGDLGDAVNLFNIADLRVRYKTVATGNIDIIAETLDTLSDLPTQ